MSDEGKKSVTIIIIILLKKKKKTQTTYCMGSQPSSIYIYIHIYIYIYIYIYTHTGLEKYLNSTLPVGQVTLNFCLSGALTRLPKFLNSLIIHKPKDGSHA